MSENYQSNYEDSSPFAEEQMSRDEEDMLSIIDEKNIVQRRINNVSASSTPSTASVASGSSSPLLSRGSNLPNYTNPQQYVQADNGEKEKKRGCAKFDASKYIKSIIYGGMDGLVSIFVSIAVAASGKSKITVLLVVVVSKLIAGAISMGMGDYLGTQADVDYAKGERKRELWEVEYYVEGEKKEMIELYMQRDLPLEVATEVVDILATNTKGFVDIMMVEELQIMPDAEKEVAWKNGLVNFVSFIVFGIIPLLPYLAYLIVASIADLSVQDSLPTFLTVIGLSVITLFGMGLYKAKLTDTKWWKSCITTVVFGCVGAGVGFATVEILKAIFPDVDISG